MSKPSLNEAQSYRDYLKHQLGRGDRGKLAIALGVHPTLVSQVLSGRKDFTREQAYLTALHLKLNEEECEGFVDLVEVERAGHPTYRKHLKQRIELRRDRDTLVESKLPKNKRILSELEKAYFYSHWWVSAVRLASSIESLQPREATLRALNISEAQYNEAREFLCTTGLCEEDGSRLVMKEARTFVSRDSSLMLRHQENWRLQACQKAQRTVREDLFFTAPLSLSERDFRKIRKALLAIIEDISQTVAQSKSEKLACLNLDFFGIAPGTRST